ncbi:hypothetical protein BUALT_Bualt09G0073100 [Buddleja alternifolia]|uniref:Uncharacterized protein n=1 Tax=Buddleja alternifolia TaxID=168488 RepID=A0AAV6X803_9LAMI|nr:hypothetical protein BUALT_Bualt09G0073100 [Buddleja alternifolia]
MAAENCVTCLLGAMDTLWFHQIILFSEPSLFPFSEIPKIPLPISENSSKNIISEPLASVITPPHMDDDESSSSQESDDDLNKETRHETSTTSNLTSPISSSAQKQSTNFGYSIKRLRKRRSCKSLFEQLEVEEVKGFMELGFIFKKDNLNKQLISLIPGLQRLDHAYKNDENDYDCDYNSNDHDQFTSKNTINEEYDDFKDGGEERKGVTMRPYLSEAWIMERYDYPSIHRVSTTAADMKKHLKCWARIVASAIQQH